MKKQWYTIQGRADNGEVTIYIVEAIGSGGITAKAFRNDLLSLGPDTPLHIHINSDGGDIIDGFEIYNLLANYKANVRVTIGALAASMASVIACAGDSVSIAANGMIMIHDPWTIARGNSDDLRKEAALMDKMKKALIKAYVKKSRATEEQIAQLMSDETWLTADEALAMGFVDAITGESEDDDLVAAAAFNFSGFKHGAIFAQQLSKFMKEKEDETRPLPEANNKNRDIDRERTRIARIREVGRKYSKFCTEEDVDRAIEEGVSLQAFQASLIEGINPTPVRPFSIGAGTGRDNHTSHSGSLGEMVTESPEIKALAGRRLPQGRTLSIELPRFNYGSSRYQNTTLTGLPGTGVDIQPGVPGDLRLQPATVNELFTQMTTEGSSVRFLQESSFTNSAAPRSEAALKATQDFALAEIDAPVRSIAAVSSFSDEVLADHSRLQNFIDTKMRACLSVALDNQCVNGTGVAPQILGVLNVSTINVQAKGADTNQDAILKGLDKVASVGFFVPDAVVISVADYEKLRLLRDGGTTGPYLFGGPAAWGPYGTPYMSQPPIWGIRTIVTTVLAAGTVLAGDFRNGAQLFWRQGLTIEFGYNMDDFVKDLVTCRAELRATLATVHPLAFVKITGIT